MGTQRKKQSPKTRAAGKTRARPAKQRKPRLKIHEITAENDIRYRGPLNYQHFQILGWLCIVLSQAVLLLSLGGRFDPQFANQTGSLVDVLSTVASLSLPFLLIANFARILNNSEGYKAQLLKNGLAMLGIAALSALILHRYVVGSLQMLSDDPTEIDAALSGIFRQMFKYGFTSFNIFVDLFLCTLVMFFLNYHPKRFFRGKSIFLFRLFTLLPIGYEIASISLKIRASLGKIELPLWSHALLTVKPPMTFLLFIILAVYVKTRELRFRRNGKTHQDFLAFLKTRKNSLHFSVFLAVQLVIVAVLDLAVFGVISYWHTEVDILETVSQMAEQVSEADPQEIAGFAAAPDEAALREGASGGSGPAEEVVSGEAAVPESGAESLSSPDSGGDPPPGQEEALEELFRSMFVRSFDAMQAVGFGRTIVLAFLAPLVLLFSYTKIPKSRQVSMMIPLAAIGLIFLLYLEGIHQLFIQYLPRLQETFDVLMESMAGM